jgi:hypothetical protein
LSKIKRYTCGVAVVVACLLTAGVSPGQQDGVTHIEPATAAETLVVRKSAFHKAVIKATREGVRSGKISLGQAVKIRSAMYSPAFREMAERAAVTQIAASGEESAAVPVNADGRIEVGRIDWEALGNFIREFLPVILEILLDLGVL